MGILKDSGKSILLFGLLSAPTLTKAAPYNFAPNSQWEIWSSVLYGTAENPQGTGTEPPIAASSNSTGAAGTTKFTVATTGDLAVGQLITASGVGVDPSLLIAPMRVTALVSNQSVTVRVPLGLTPSISHSATLTPVVVGNLSATTGNAADGWHKDVTLPAWREFYPINITPNARYALGLTKDVAGPEHVSIQFSTPREMANWAGKTVSFGIYGYQKVKHSTGTWSVWFNDSVNGQRSCTSVAASVSYQWSECSVTIPLGSSYFYAGVELSGATADTYYFEDPVLAVASSIGDVGQYTKPQEVLLPVVHISPISMINAMIVFTSTKTITGDGQVYYLFTFDPFADTGGRIAPTVRSSKGQLEGFDNGAPQLAADPARIMAWYDRLSDPQHSGSFLPQYPSQTTCVFTGSNPVQTASCTQKAVKSYMYMDMPLNQIDTGADVRGTAIITSRVPSDTWNNVSLEFDEFLLD